MATNSHLALLRKGRARYAYQRLAGSKNAVSITATAQADQLVVTSGLKINKNRHFQRFLRAFAGH
jgi:hypothetical protein